MLVLGDRPWPEWEYKNVEINIVAVTVMHERIGGYKGFLSIILNNNMAMNRESNESSSPT